MHLNDYLSPQEALHNFRAKNKIVFAFWGMLQLVHPLQGVMIFVESLGVFLICRPMSSGTLSIVETVPWDNICIRDLRELPLQKMIRRLY